jgi:hypothetical protein
VTTFRTILVFSVLLSATSGRIDAQRSYRLNTMNVVYGEFFLLTPSQNFYQPAVSYERLFSPKRTLSGRIGVILNVKHKVLTFPLTLQGYTMEGKQHHIEYGGGVMPSVDYNLDKGDMIYAFYPVLIGGYRYQRGTGLVFRATANVILHPFILNPSVSLGFLF